MSNELTPFKVKNLPVVSQQTLEAVDDVSQSQDFLPRIQLITKGKYVDMQKIPPGHWGIPLKGDDITDLGESVDLLPFAARSKALDVSDKEAIVAVYDVEDPEFQRIRTAPKNTGCMWGPSFLVLERSTGKLYELFLGNKSGRAEAGKMKPFLPVEGRPYPLPCTVNIRYKKGKDYGWHVPVIIKCSEPFDPEKCVPPEKVLKEIEKFMHPEEGTKKAEEATTKNRRAR